MMGLKFLRVSLTEGAPFGSATPTFPRVDYAQFTGCSISSQTMVGLILKLLRQMVFWQNHHGNAKRGGTRKKVQHLKSKASTEPRPARNGTPCTWTYISRLESLEMIFWGHLPSSLTLAPSRSSRAFRIRAHRGMPPGPPVA